jgi:hypothetical protein
MEQPGSAGSGSCGIAMRRERRTLRGMVVISIPSIRIVPALWSISRSSSDKKVLFPLEFKSVSQIQQGLSFSCGRQLPASSSTYSNSFSRIDRDVDVL